MPGGTGTKLTFATTIVAGVASLAATLLSIVSIWFQTKHYRKPLLQRYVVRILLMVPIYSIASWSSIVSTSLAFWLDPIRDIYEAFTIYTFFQLLINYIGGERALLIMTHGREPVHHLWPLNHVLSRVDISDPYTFLAIKRGILQYAWLKPILGLAAIVMKATGIYQEGYIGLTSGYLWSGLIYNISVTICLYALGLFWVCMHKDLKPFRPLPKFLCIKLIIFASYWQGFFLSILVWLGALPDDVQGYTPDNLAAAIQDFLICIEMPGFAIAHWYAFSWQDFADENISAARMPVFYAVRDAFGVRDLIQDSKETLKGDKYVYRTFDSGDKIMAHEASHSRLARLQDGMRYERGGKGKYWIPRPNEISQTTPLLGANGCASTSHEPTTARMSTLDGTILDLDEEILYDKARKLEFGDWNYPVVTVTECYMANRLSSSLGANTRAFDTTVPPAKSGSSVGERNRGARQACGIHGTPKTLIRGQERLPSHGYESKRDRGKDPLEIAYGPIVGTISTITEDDFEVSSESKVPDPEPEGPSSERSNTASAYRSAHVLKNEDETDNVWRK